MLLTRWVARHATEVENVAPRVGLGGRGHVRSAGMGGWFFSWANVGCFGWFLVARHAIEAENVAPRAGLGGGDMSAAWGGCQVSLSGKCWVFLVGFGADLALFRRGRGSIYSSRNTSNFWSCANIFIYLEPHRPGLSP